MINTLQRMFLTGILTEPLEPHLEPRTSNLEPSLLEPSLQHALWAILGRALCIRHVDAGSCNACELELHALNNPYYNLEGIGIKFVASPRHADALLVTGPVSVNMEEALRRTYDAIPNPKLVVAIGDCATCGGIFAPTASVGNSDNKIIAGSTAPNYATRGPISAIIPVNHTIPGCPPTPHAILTGLIEALTNAANRPTHKRQSS
jgi:Ni,Fe-hydrogenase III small subunit